MFFYAYCAVDDDTDADADADAGCVVYGCWFCNIQFTENERDEERNCVRFYFLVTNFPSSISKMHVFSDISYSNQIVVVWLLFSKDFGFFLPCVAIIIIRFSSIFIENFISFSHACCRFSTDLMYGSIFFDISFLFCDQTNLVTSNWRFLSSWFLHFIQVLLKPTEPFPSRENTIFTLSLFIDKFRALLFGCKKSVKTERDRDKDTRISTHSSHRIEQIFAVFIFTLAFFLFLFLYCFSKQ